MLIPSINEFLLSKWKLICGEEGESVWYLVVDGKYGVSGGILWSYAIQNGCEKAQLEELLRLGGRCSIRGADCLSQTPYNKGDKSIQSN